MRLKYVGAADLTGLARGEIYPCTIETRWGNLVLTVMDDKFNGHLFTIWYKNIKQLMTDWDEADD